MSRSHMPHVSLSVNPPTPGRPAGPTNSPPVNGPEWKVETGNPFIEGGFPSRVFCGGKLRVSTWFPPRSNIDVLRVFTGNLPLLLPIVHGRVGDLERLGNLPSGHPTCQHLQGLSAPFV